MIEYYLLVNLYVRVIKSNIYIYQKIIYYWTKLTLKDKRSTIDVLSNGSVELFNENVCVSIVIELVSNICLIGNSKNAIISLFERASHTSIINCCWIGFEHKICDICSNKGFVWFSNVWVLHSVVSTLIRQNGFGSRRVFFER
jgi:hypothetical protein